MRTEGEGTDINTIDTGQTTEIVRISDSTYSGIRTVKNNALAYFESAVSIYNSIPDDIAWSGKSKDGYVAVKSFIDQFMRDFPEAFNEMNYQVNEISAILEDLFTEMSQTVKDFNNYDD